jgi:hypothetical protein
MEADAGQLQLYGGWIFAGFAAYEGGFTQLNRGLSQIVPRGAVWNRQLFHVEQFRSQDRPNPLQADLADLVCFVGFMFAEDYSVLCI